MRCFYMLLREGGKRQNVWSAGAAGAECWNLTQRWANLPWSWWGIGHPEMKSKTSIGVFTCYEGHQDFPLVGIN